MAYYNTNYSIAQDTNWCKKFLMGFSALAVAAAGALFIVRTSHAVDPVAVDCSTNPAALTEAIASANTGDTLNVSGDCVVDSQVTVDKQLTIQGTAGNTVTVNSSYGFVVTAGGSDTIFQNLNFVKGGTAANTAIISDQYGNNVQILNNTFTAVGVSADTVVRAIEVSPATTGFVISGNTISGFTYPMYINGETVGTVANNTVTGAVEGFVVVTPSDVTFTGNTIASTLAGIKFFGDGTSAVNTTNVTCAEVNQIAATNDASVVNEADPNCVVKNYNNPATKEECKNMLYKQFATVGGAQRFKNQGACVSYVQANGNAKFKQNQ